MSIHWWPHKSINESEECLRPQQPPEWGPHTLVVSSWTGVPRGWLGLLWLTWLVSFCVLCCQRVATWRSTPPQSRLRLTTRHCRWVPWQGTAGMANRAIQFGLFLMQSLKFYYHPVEFELMLSVLTWPKAFLCKNFSEVDYSYFKVSGKKIKVKLKQGICIQSNVIITWSNIFMMLYSSLQWLGQNMNISLNPQKTHHTSP